MRTFILPYKPGRRVPRELTKLMRWKRIRLVDSQYRAKDGDVIINWGRSAAWSWEFSPLCYLVNGTHPVTNTVNKHTALQILYENGVKTVDFTHSPVIAYQWCMDAQTVYCRTKLNGHSGEGIIIVPPGHAFEIVNAPLYTKGVGKCREYRVHVIGGEVVLIAQKKRRNGGEADGAIKNHHTGWVYSTIDITPLSDAAVSDAIRAINSLNLDFGAVDIATRGDSHYVLEVNTAPGLHGVTLETYATHLDKLVKKIREERF